MRLFRAVLMAATFGIATSACGVAESSHQGPTGDRPETVQGFGLSLTVPPGWTAEVSRPGPEWAPLLRAATFELEAATDIGQEAQRTMGDDDILITVADYGPLPHAERLRELPKASLPITIDRADLGNFEGFRKPVATRAFVLSDHGLQVWVVFGSNDPPEGLLTEANAVLATFAFEPR